MKKRGLFRDTPTDLLMIIGFVITFFVTINGTYLMQQIQNSKTSSEMLYPYSIEIRLPFFEREEQKSDEIPELIKMIQSVSQGNVSLELEEMAGDSLDEYPVQYIVKKNESLPYRIQQSEKKIGEEGKLYAGYHLLQYAKEKGGTRYLALNGQQLPVSGELKADRMSDLSWTAIVQWENLSKEEQNQMIETMKMYFQNSSPILRIEGNDDVSQIFHQLTAKIEKKFGISPILIEAEEMDLSVSAFLYQKYGAIFSAFSALFAIINCLVIVRVWMYRRKREWMIRRIFGYSLWKLGKSILLELGKLAVVAFAVTGVLQIIYQQVSQIQNVWRMQGTNVAYTLAACLGIFLILWGWTIVSLWRLKPAAGLTKM